MGTGQGLYQKGPYGNVAGVFRGIFFECRIDDGQAVLDARQGTGFPLQAWSQTVKTHFVRRADWLEQQQLLVCDADQFRQPRQREPQQWQRQQQQ